MMKEEYFDIVNENNETIGKATRQECHSNRNLIHRSIYLLLFNSKNELFVKKRSLKKDLYKGLWEISTSGHVLSGEKPEAAIKRETKEELGILPKKIKKIFIFKDYNKYEKEISTLFSCIYNGEIKINLEEASEGKFYSFNKLVIDIKNNKVKLAPWSKKAILKYAKFNKSEKF